ncbi:hypothetical protein CBS101457_004750 [Exobasidium rhododendri]|nr:hypothetical protein CBS101457_004750 [Exobasidium rhododendri]
MATSSTRSIVTSIARQQTCRSSSAGQNWTCRSCQHATLRFSPSIFTGRSISSTSSHQQKVEDVVYSEVFQKQPLPVARATAIESTKDASIDSEKAPGLPEIKGMSMTERKRLLKSEKKSGKLKDRLGRKQESKKRQAAPIDKAKVIDVTRLSSSQVKKWERNMESMHETQSKKGEEPVLEAPPSPSTVEVDGKEGSKKVFGDVKTRTDRAARLATTIDKARNKQVDLVSDSSRRRVVSTTKVLPGFGTGLNPSTLRFETTEIIYPPKEIYPPPCPLVHEIDLQSAALALGINRSCEVEWDSSIGERGNWRKTNRTSAYYEERGLYDCLQDERGLEYLGDACLHLISRSLILSQYPGKVVSAYNAASSWIVSNDCFGYMFEDSGLEEQRLYVATLLVEESKKRELRETAPYLTEEERRYREEMPSPEPQIATTAHLRKADLFEAYVGAVYSVYGFPTVVKWCTVLMSPWVNMIGETPEFQVDRFLTTAGEALKRRAQREKKEAEELAKEAAKPWWRKATSRLFSGFTSSK